MGEVHLLIERARVGDRGTYLLRARCGQERTFKGSMPEDFTGWGSMVTCWVCSGGTAATRPQEQPQPVPVAQQAAPKPARRPTQPNPRREAAAHAQAVRANQGDVTLPALARRVFGLEMLISVDLPYANFGVVVIDGRITEAAPIAGWSVGKTLVEFRRWAESKGGTLVTCR